MRVFLDTNVIVAAVATRGLCADVMREALARHEFVISETLLNEVTAVLCGKIGASAAVVADLVSLVQDGAVLAFPSEEAELPVPDQADRALVSAALNGKAEVFVTGDAELLAFREFGPMAVVSPRGFWERVKAAPRS